MTLKGYLGSEQIAQANQNLAGLNNSDQLIIQINSRSADLNEVLELAKKIYNIKLKKQIKVILYIDDNAVGPAAILPLLADELYISSVVSWGDIPLGTNNAIPTNILLNRVTSLITGQDSQPDVLKKIAAQMIEFDQSQRIGIEGAGAQGTGPLVLNQVQLKELNLIKGIVSQEQFESLYPLSETQKAQLQAIPSTSLVVSPQSLEEKLKAHIHFDPHKTNLIGRIVIDDRTAGITEGTWIFVKKALDHYKTVKPIFIILELNTPGGEVFAAQKISDALKEMDTQYNIPVVAFINNWAISAGAMLAYSTRFITVVKDGAMGAAEPVIQGESGETKTASEKINSALRADFANRARFFDRNPYIAEAMVDKDVILVQRHGKIIRVDHENQVRSTGIDPDTLINPKGKLLTLNAQQLIDYGVADLMVLPEKLEAITAQEKEEGKWPANKSLLFQAPFFDQIPQAVIDDFEMDWKTKFFVLLSTPVISSLLFLGLMIGLYTEINSPGLGIGGTIGLTCLFLIILSSFALEVGNILELIFLVTGLLIILVELFVLPTFGLLGFIGILLFFAGLFGLMLPGIGSVEFEYDTKTLNAAGEVFMERLAWLCGTLVLAVIVILGMARYLPSNFAGFKRFVLSGNEQDASQGYISVDDLSSFPKEGSEGDVVSTLRPAGKVLIDNKLYDAISRGTLIEKGTRVQVLRIDGGQLVVEEKI